MILCCKKKYLHHDLHMNDYWYLLNKWTKARKKLIKMKKKISSYFTKVVIWNSKIHETSVILHQIQSKITYPDSIKLETQSIHLSLKNDTDHFHCLCNIRACTEPRFTMKSLQNIIFCILSSEQFNLFAALF